MQFTMIDHSGPVDKFHYARRWIIERAISPRHAVSCIKVSTGSLEHHPPTPWTRLFITPMMMTALGPPRALSGNQVMMIPHNSIGQSPHRLPGKHSNLTIITADARYRYTRMSNRVRWSDRYTGDLWVRDSLWQLPTGVNLYPHFFYTPMSS